MNHLLIARHAERETLELTSKTGKTFGYTHLSEKGRVQIELFAQYIHNHIPREIKVLTSPDEAAIITAMNVCALLNCGFGMHPYLHFSTTWPKENGPQQHDNNRLLDIVNSVSCESLVLVSHTPIVDEFAPFYANLKGFKDYDIAKLENAKAAYFNHIANTWTIIP